MKTVTLTQIEVTGIQEYIFGSNNLQQNVGASELVARATTQWVTDALYEIGLIQNATWDNEASDIDLVDHSAGRSEVQAEVVYAGGGNALVLFDGPVSMAVEFTKELSRRALCEARGLTLAVGHLSFDWDTEPLSQKHLELRRGLGKQKLSRPQSMPVNGLGVTAACAYTGLPAVGLDRDRRPVSAAVRCKMRCLDLAKGRLGHHFLNGQPDAVVYEDFVSDFDLLGTRGDSAYLAVVHADGNGMAERFQAIAEQHSAAVDNEAYVARLRLFSQAVERRSNAALRRVVGSLMRIRDDDLFGGLVPVPRKDGKEYLPFRPIVFGGDDVTFICEGRLGLVLAEKYLREVAGENLPGPREGQTGEPLYCRAGVAVVKSHYPFSRAYGLAEALCGSAKKKIEALVDGKGAVMDWHFSSSGVVLPLREVRAREYTAVDGKSLLMRPVRLNMGAGPPPGSKYWRSWETLEGLLKAFGDRAGKWADRRNKVKALQEALRRGPSAVQQFRANYGVEELPRIEGQSTMQATGWQADDCGYFDGIEALDFYVPLAGSEEGDA